MNAIRGLMAEHQNILRALDVLEEIADRVTEVPDEIADDARAIVGFIQGYADELHHGKEESMLFPAMEAAGELRGGGPIAIMLHDHEQGRAFVRQMDAATDDLTRDGERFSDAAFDFAALLREHIDKENEVLFPMAESMLPKQVFDDLTERFRHFDDVQHAEARDKHLRTLEALEAKRPEA